MNFLKKLFGDDDDKNKRKPSSKANRPPTKRPNIQQMAQASQRAWDDKPLDEIVNVIVSAPADTDWREARMAGGTSAGMNVKRAWSALEAIQKRDDSQAVFDALIPHINISSNNLQYQRALASVGEAIAVTTLLDFSKNGQTNERLNALKALAEMRAGTAAEGLVEFIYDDDQGIRTQAIRALGFTGHPIAHNALKDYDHKQYAIRLNLLHGAQRWCNVPKTLEEFRKRKAKGDLGIDETLARLEEQYDRYWQDT